MRSFRLFVSSVVSVSSAAPLQVNLSSASEADFPQAIDLVPSSLDSSPSRGVSPRYVPSLLVTKVSRFFHKKM